MENKRVTVGAISRRTALLFAAALAVRPGFAQTARTWGPSRLVTIVHPYQAGASMDLMARIMAKHLSELWGQSVIVEPRPGGNGIPAGNHVLASPADGHMLYGAASSLAMDEFVVKSMPFKPSTDFAPVAVMMATYMVLVASTAVPEKDGKAFLDAARLKPMVRSIGAAESVTRVLAYKLSKVSGTQLNIIPYKGGAPTMNDLVGGHVDTAFLSPASVSGLLSAGKVKVLGITSRERWSTYPDFPTFTEMGYPEMTHAGFLSLFTSAKTPLPIQRQINEDLRLILARPDVVEKIKELGAIPTLDTLEQARTRFSEAVATYRTYAREAGIVAE